MPGRAHNALPDNPCGFFDDEMPYLRIGDVSARERMLVIPGIGDAFYDGAYLQEQGWPLRTLVERSYQPYLKDRAVWLVGRSRSMPNGTSTADMAKGYVDHVLSRLGPVTLRGESMGGMIATHIADAYPELVDQLVLVATGYRISPYANTAMEQWEAMARSGAWNELYLDMARHLYAGWRAGVPKHYDALASAFGLRHHPRDAGDFLVSLAACRAHDTQEALSKIGAPTLVICGREDELFTPDIQQVMAQQIPNARLCLIDNAAHGLYLEKKALFDAEVLAFLDDTRECKR